MKIQTNFKTFAIILLIVISTPKLCYSQNRDSVKVLIVSSKVGKTIDLQEKKKYSILTYIVTATFDSAQFLQFPDSSIIIRIWKKDGKTIDRPSSNYQFLSTRELLEGKSEEYVKKITAKIDYDSNDTNSVYIITMQDGTILNGKIIEKRKTEIEFETNTLGKITIPINKIEEIKKVDASSFKSGKYWFPNPNATRYLFAPSAYNLGPGEGYYQNVYVLINSFNVGITKNISIGGGLEFLSTFVSLTEGDFQPIFFITSKIGFKVANKFNMAGGILYGSFPGLFGGERSSAGIIFGLGTYGTTDHNITAGTGFGFINGEFSERPIITINGMTRVARKTALITENWIIPTKRYEYNYNTGTSSSSNTYTAIISYGIRFFGEKLSVDLALINNKDIAEFIIIGIPYIGFVVKF